MNHLFDCLKRMRDRKWIHKRKGFLVCQLSDSDMIAHADEELKELADALRSKDKNHIREELADVLNIISHIAVKHEIECPDLIRDAAWKLHLRYEAYDP